MFVGLALGTAENDRALFIAIIFHQFFEGLGLGSRVAVANLGRFISILAIDVTFAASTPVGIGIGIGIKSAIEQDSHAYIVDGTPQVHPQTSKFLCMCAHVFIGPQCARARAHAHNQIGPIRRHPDLRCVDAHDPRLHRSRGHGHGAPLARVRLPPSLPPHWH